MEDRIEQTVDKLYDLIAEIEHQMNDAAIVLSEDDIGFLLNQLSNMAEFLTTVNSFVR